MRNNFANKIKVPVDQAINLLNDLIVIPSIKGKKNDAIISFLEKELAELDCHPEIFTADSDKFLNHPEYNPLSEGVEKRQKYISGIIKGIGGGKSVLLYSHLDTEDIADIDWNTNPFQLVKKGDRLLRIGKC